MNTVSKLIVYAHGRLDLHSSVVTHFSMWALVKSPLILGNDVTSMVKLFGIYGV